MFLAIISDGRNIQNLACWKTKKIPTFSGGQYPVSTWQLLGKYSMDEGGPEGKHSQSGSRRRRWGGTWRDLRNPHCLCFVVQHQRHHVVIAGTLEEGTRSFPTTIEKWNNKPKSSKEPERPPEGYLPVMVFHLKAGGIPDILMRKASGIMFALQVPIIPLFIKYSPNSVPETVLHRRKAGIVFQWRRKTCGKKY